MRSTVLRAAGAVAIAASLLHAQTTTTDGVRAFVRGDYQGAVEILQPLAESWPFRDHVAEFFMATMYEDGRGVPADALRACALYVRASEDREGPVGRQAGALLQHLQASMSGDEFRRCALLARVGFDHGFQPVTFTLEPGYWIALDLDSATIAYDGTEKHTDLGVATGGVVFLPVERTDLTTGSPPSRRHFIEYFVWLPGKDHTWSLQWTVFEVIRHDLVSVAAASLVRMSAERPPLEPPVDLHARAHLRVNEQGDVEWTALSGPNQQSGVIESDTDRRARTERTMARQAADARVDWNRRGDDARRPSLTYADANGCGNIFVYGWSADRMEAIALRADRDLLGLSTAPRRLDVASLPAGFELQIHVYERPLRQPFCTDIGSEGVSEEIWTASSGSLTIELSPGDVVPGAPWAYRATVRIADAEFVSRTGARIRLMRPLTLTAIVGGLLG